MATEEFFSNLKKSVSKGNIRYSKQRIMLIDKIAVRT